MSALEAKQLLFGDCKYQGKQPILTYALFFILLLDLSRININLGLIRMNKSQEVQHFHLIIKRLKPAPQFESRLRIMSKQSGKQWKTKKFIEFQEVKLLVDSEDLTVQILKKNKNEEWKPYGEGVINNYLKNTIIYYIHDKKTALCKLEHISTLQKNPDSQNNSNIFDNLIDPEASIITSQEGKIKYQKKMSDSVSKEKKYENLQDFQNQIEKAEEISAEKVVNHNQNYKASQKESEKQRKEMKQTEGVENNFVIQKYWEINDFKEKTFIKFENFTFEINNPPEKIVFLALSQNEEKILAKVVNNNSHVWEFPLILPYKECQSFLFKLSIEQNQYYCCLGNEQLLTLSCTIYSKEGKDEGFFSFKYKILKQISLQTEQILEQMNEGEEPKRMSQCQQQKSEMLNMKKKNQNKKSEEISQILHILSNQFGHSQEQKNTQKQIVDEMNEFLQIKEKKKSILDSNLSNFNSNSPCGSMRGDFSSKIMNFKAKRKLRKFTEVDIKISPTSSLFKSDKFNIQVKQQILEEEQTSKVESSRQNNFFLKMMPVENQIDKSGRTGKSLYRKRLIPNLTKNKQKIMNIKIVSLCIILNKLSFEPKYLKISINGWQPYLTQTSSQASFHSWIGKSYFFEAIPISSLLQIESFSDFGGSTRYEGSCRICVSNLAKSNQLQQFSGTLSKENSEEIGILQFVYEINEAGKKSNLSTIDPQPSQIHHKKTDHIRRRLKTESKQLKLDKYSSMKIHRRKENHGYFIADRSHDSSTQINHKKSKQKTFITREPRFKPVRYSKFIFQ